MAAELLVLLKAAYRRQIGVLDTQRALCQRFNAFWGSQLGKKPDGQNISRSQLDPNEASRQ
jgi:hypothetical protein